jgi:hypothetical protein
MTSTSATITPPAQPSALSTSLASTRISVGAEIGIASKDAVIVLLTIFFVVIISRLRFLQLRQRVTRDGKRVEVTAKQTLGLDNATYFGGLANKPGG